MEIDEVRERIVKKKIDIALRSSNGIDFSENDMKVLDNMLLSVNNDLIPGKNYRMGSYYEGEYVVDSSGELEWKEDLNRYHNLFALKLDDGYLTYHYNMQEGTSRLYLDDDFVFDNYYDLRSGPVLEPAEAISTEELLKKLGIERTNSSLGDLKEKLRKLENGEEIDSLDDLSDEEDIGLESVPIDDIDDEIRAAREIMKLAKNKVEILEEIKEHADLYNAYKKQLDIINEKLSGAKSLED